LGEQAATQRQLEAPPPFWMTRPRDRAAVALIVIDMQVDFCAPGGWVDQLGEDVANTRAAIAPVAAVLAQARALRLQVLHTREGHRPDLADLHANKRWRTRLHGLGIGDAGRMGRILTRGEPGWAILPELAPRDEEAVLDKPGKGGFHATPLDLLLRMRGVTHLALCGVTTDCCVQATLREALEHGYDAMLIEDACAAVEGANHAGTLALLRAGGGRFGGVATAAALFAALDA
jgi:biuret amidohydrolase